MKKNLVLAVYASLFIASIASPGNAVECPDLTSASTFNEVTSIVRDKSHQTEPWKISFFLGEQPWYMGPVSKSKLLSATGPNEIKKRGHFTERNVLHCMYDVNDEGFVINTDLEEATQEKSK